MTDDVRRRAACDRCHSQKIRCPRQPGQAVCSRCVKAGTQCIFSPFRQKKPVDEANRSGGTPIDHQDLDGNGQSSAIASSTSLTRQKRRRVASPQISTSPVVVSESPLQSLEPFNVDDLGLDWLTDQYPLSQDFVVDPMFNDMNAEGQDTLSFLPGITSPFGYSVPERDANPMVQYRKEANLSRAIKTSSALLLGTDDALLQSRPQESGAFTGRWMPDVEAPHPDPTTCMQRLSQLSSDLFEHSQALPPLSIHDPAYADKDSTLQSAAKDYTRFVLEDTFRHTQTLIDVYPSFLLLTPQTTPRSRLHPPNPLLPPPPHIHLRTTIPTHGDMHKNKGIALTAEAATLTVPKLYIGSYCPPPSSAVPMQMLLLVQFASQLFGYASDLAEEIEGSGDEGENLGGGEASTMALTKAAAANVKERAGSMTQELGEMRGIMLHSGMLA
ncbi:uncharacterized protein PAC_11237 [Phialocephala subalpina]|uniref:Zn(2)-C6 fungal-type domain-containing protein n=1 Tax=Phialocephala subalpina TaxID=576137 RepID=A0A1L7X8I9_9HELO|nr:uncharacterized protein PAC_11237 [Phialocephala subalpina]